MPNVLINRPQISLTHSSPMSRFSTVHFPAHTYYCIFHHLILDSIQAVNRDRYHFYEMK